MHESHLGTNKIRKVAKKHFYWPAMNSELENYVLSCLICQKYQRSNIKEPLNSHEIPKIPFNKIGMDIAEFAGKNYLVVVDYFSRLIELCEIKKKTSSSIIAIN